MSEPRFGHFREDERGALTIFGLFVFILMMVAGGVALDLMRAEVNRSKLQNTADRAVLAAASVSQTRDAREVVRDYLRAAGLDENAITVKEVNTGTSREVTLEYDLPTQSLFMNVFGIDRMITPVSSSATEMQTHLEVSLVLDISGSMGGQKIVNMRKAATDFVAELLLDREAVTNISVVPYNDRVNLGAQLAGYLPLSDAHPHSYCVSYGFAEYQTVGVAAGTVLTRLGHFDQKTDGDAGNAPGLVPNPHCGPGDGDAVLPWSNDLTTLSTAINGLSAGEWTAMDLGVKTGALLLDPTVRGSLNSMVADGFVSPFFTGQPFDYTERSTRKVLVVMTDGVNTYQWDLRDDRRQGPSGVWVWNAAAPRGNMNDVEDPESWAVAGYPLTAWDQPPDKKFVYSIWSEAAGAYYVQDGKGKTQYVMEPVGGAAAVEIDYADLFANMTIDYIADELMGQMAWSDRKDMRNSWERRHDQTSADANLSAICAAARARGIIIYTIAFQAPSDGRKAMRDCAGSEFAGNYFNVTDLDVDSAFDEILSSMNRLRLVQ